MSRHAAVSSHYISHYQQKHAELEALMTRDLHADDDELDKAWTAKNPEL
ncbi:hypothetical protein K8B83_15040 [Shewanella inventionis]|nr:hypothetical protein [Shewanella inventionis]UAL42184.1 hypothetical protein K8B83_15040 [Shewanella inventionis]